MIKQNIQRLMLSTFCLLAVSTLIPSQCLAASSSKPTPQFYAYCVELGVPGVKQRPIVEQVKLLKKLGFDAGGFLMWLDDKSIAANLHALDEGGLSLAMLEINVNIGEKGPAYDPRLPDAIRKLKGRDATICVTMTGRKPGDPAGLAPAIKLLRELGDVAAEARCRISVYQHVGAWSESLPFIFDVVRQVNHPQVGANFNLCHYLKLHGDTDYRPLLRANADKIFCVTICGATRGAKTWTNGLIRPLDEGDFDNHALVAYLREIGYRGPIGAMCYGIPGKPEEYLPRTLKMLKAWTQD